MCVYAYIVKNICYKNIYIYTILIIVFLYTSETGKQSSYDGWVTVHWLTEADNSREKDLFKPYSCLFYVFQNYVLWSL